MKQFFKMFFASLLAIVVSGFILIGMFVGALVNATKSLTEREKKVVTGNVLSIDLKNHFHENSEMNSLSFLGSGNEYEVGVYDLIKTLGHAKNDPAIKGIVLKLSGTPNGWATLQQLRAALVDFKVSGKFIYAYGESIPQSAYYVATAADSIYLNPAGSIELKGFATVLSFFKGTLEKLEITPEIFYAGKFKSATEPFRADKISDPNRLQIQAFQAGIWNEFVSAIASFTHADIAAVNDWTQKGSILFPADALNKKMLTGLLYWDQVEQRIRAKTGMKIDATVKLTSIEDYAESNKNSGKYSDPRIAVLFAEGEIKDGSTTEEHEIASETICEQIRKLANNSNVKAVVLRVNSPGGSALASEVILRELSLLKQKKPLIVSMGDLAASGGYYISCQADSIFAIPNTITGSIGVFAMMFDVDRMMKNKLGVTFDEVKNAPYADVPSAFRPLSPEEGQRMQSYVDTIYEMFKSRVSKGRKISLADVDSIAQGRVWTGTDALKIHLVDALGGLNRAVSSAAAMAKLTTYRVVTYPETEDKLNKILNKLKKGNVAEDEMKNAIKSVTGKDYELYEKLRSLRNMNGKVMMAMPFVPTIE